MQKLRTELIACHDCGKAISFRAASCPHCGSAEPTGPYVFSRKEARRLRIEDRNDNSLMVMTVLCGGIGLVYGMMSSAGLFGAVLAGTGYGLLGLLIGVPAGFVIIATRHLFP